MQTLFYLAIQNIIWLSDFHVYLQQSPCRYGYDGCFSLLSYILLLILLLLPRTLRIPATVYPLLPSRCMDRCCGLALCHPPCNAEWATASCGLVLCHPPYNAEWAPTSCGLALCHPPYNGEWAPASCGLSLCHAPYNAEWAPASCGLALCHPPLQRWMSPGVLWTGIVSHTPLTTLNEPQRLVDWHCVTPPPLATLNEPQILVDWHCVTPLTTLNEPRRLIFVGGGYELQCHLPGVGHRRSLAVRPLPVVGVFLYGKPVWPSSYPSVDSQWKCCASHSFPGTRGWFGASLSPHDLHHLCGLSLCRSPLFCSICLHLLSVYVCVFACVYYSLMNLLNLCIFI